MARASRLSRAEFPTRPPKRRVADELFSVSLWPINIGLEPKCSCVVSKKVAAKAVDRNTLKRRSREIVAPLVSAFKQPVAIVVYPKKAALNASFAEIKVSLSALLAKLAL
ncbi:ribonuclease P protein component [Candidatus Parcubacteria bacterium]|nr:MAG: ribonuclease P protein component [Candidatus Parcubacteria bacterium]